MIAPARAGAVARGFETVSALAGVALNGVPKAGTLDDQSTDVLHRFLMIRLTNGYIYIYTVVDQYLYI